MTKTKMYKCEHCNFENKSVSKLIIHSINSGHPYKGEDNGKKN